MEIQTNQIALLIRTFTLTFFAFVSVKASSQFYTVNKSNQQWFQYYQKLEISNKFKLKTDAGFRLKNQFSDPSLYIVRTALEYSTNDKSSFSAGFAHLGSFSSNSISTIEYRPYQEFIYKVNIEKVKLQHRFRVEEQFFRYRNPQGSLLSTSFNLRFRYRALFNIKLSKPKNGSKKPVFLLNVGDEIHLRALTNKSVFNQNRILLGTTCKLNKGLSLSLLYNRQFMSTSTPSQFNLTNVYWLGIKHNIYSKETI